MFGVTPLSPAYGRDYKNKKDCEADFAAGKDFVTSGGQYINKEQLDALRLKTVEIRFNKQRSLTVVKL